MPRTAENTVDRHPTVSYHGKARSRFTEESIKETSILIMLSIEGNPHCQGEDLELIIRHAINHHKKPSFLIGDEI